MEERLTALEKQPLEANVSPEATAAFEAELKKLQDSLAAQRSEVEKMVSDAQALEAKASAEARAATNAAILSRLHGQLDAGQPYEELVAELKAGGVDVPDALAASAKRTGLRRLLSLALDVCPCGAHGACRCARCEQRHRAGCVSAAPDRRAVGDTARGRRPGRGPIARSGSAGRW